MSQLELADKIARRASGLPRLTRAVLVHIIPHLSCVHTYLQVDSHSIASSISINPRDKKSAFIGPPIRLFTLNVSSTIDLSPISTASGRYCNTRSHTSHYPQRTPKLRPRAIQERSIATAYLSTFCLPPPRPSFPSTLKHYREPSSNVILPLCTLDSLDVSDRYQSSI